MRAIIVDPGVPHALRLSHGPDPIPTSHQVLVDVRHVSLNPAEVRMAAEGKLPAGLVVGWEASGVVIAAPECGDPGRFASAGPHHSPSWSGPIPPGRDRDEDPQRRMPPTWESHRTYTGFSSLGGGLGNGLGGYGSSRGSSYGQEPAAGGSTAGRTASSATGSSAASRSAAGSAPVAAGTVAMEPSRRPMVGDRVVTRGRVGGWAERLPVDIENVVVIPDGVDLAAAATLPVAGSTALGALQAAGPTIGRRVLITGAAGGVGRFAVQLAALSGAHVIASVGSESRGEGLEELGASEVVVGLKGIRDTVDIVLDGVGGAQMVEAFGLLSPGGTLQSYGWSSNEPASFPPYSTVGPGRSLTAFSLPTTGAPNLPNLLKLVASGKLRVEIGWRGEWEQYQDAIDALNSRRVNGKVILDVT